MTKKTDDFNLIIRVPRDKVDIDKLNNLLDAKGDLIKKALDVDDLPIEVGETEVAFPWFKDLNDFDTSTAYTDFIAALCKMTMEQKRISSSAKPVENEKYTFRCFLLRLGFIGPEYKTERKILLQNLSGSAAFREGAEHEDAE